MKAVKKLILFFLVGQLAFTAYSCKDTEEPGDPTIGTFSASKTSVSAGDEIEISIIANADPDRTLKTIKLEEKLAGATTASKILDSTVSTNNVGITRTYKIPSTAPSGSRELILTVTDNESGTTTKTIVLTVAASSVLSDCGNKSMGAQDNADAGSFYNTTECMVYFVNEAKTNSSKVDFVYFYGTTNLATIAAPDDNSFGNGATQISKLGVQDWATKNATRFKKLSGFEFANATAAEVETAYNNSSVSAASKVSALANDDVVGFKTATGKFGVLKISDITPMANGTTKVAVRVQQ